MQIPLCSRADSERLLCNSIAESPGAPWRSVVRAIVVDDAVAGLCGLAIVRGAEEGELWYLVAPEQWGRGVATAAARQMLDFAFGELALHRVWATCLPENPGSARVLEKAGMRQEGFLVRNVKIQGEWRDSFLYAILVDEACAGN